VPQVVKAANLIEVWGKTEDCRTGAKAASSSAKAMEDRQVAQAANLIEVWVKTQKGHGAANASKDSRSRMWQDPSS